MPSSNHRRPTLRSGAFSRTGITVQLLLATVGTLACTTEPTSEPPTGAGADTVVVGTPTTFENVNELISQGSLFNSTIVRQMFLWLADEDLDPELTNPSFTPRLAESWEIAPDGLTLTFQLREDAFWSDGEPVTAEDVRFTWQAQTSPEVAWPYAEYKANIEDVEVLSPHEVRFHFRSPSSTAVLDAVEGGILPSHVWSQLPFAEWREQPQWFRDHLVVSGPFRLETWEPRQRLVLEANPAYYDEELPRLQRVVFVNIEEPAVRLNQLLSGEIDVLYGVTPSDADRIREHPDLDLQTYPGIAFTFVIWNTQRPTFDDARVRRALAHAVDRREIVETLWDELAQPHESIISSWHWAHSDLEPLPYDPELAARLLEEAGWTMGPEGVRVRDGEPFTFELATNPGSEARWSAMQMIAEDLGALGIEVENRRIEFQQLNAMNFEHDFDATLTAFTMDTTLELGTLLHSESIDAGYNFGSYSHPEMDRRIEAVRELTDLAEAVPHVHAVERLLREEQPFLFLWEPRQVLATRTDVEVVTDLAAPFAELHLWRRTGGGP